MGYQSIVTTLFLLSMTEGLYSAVHGSPPIWPLWVGDGQGAVGIKDEGVAQDNHTGFDYGTDRWGAWANLEIKDAGGNVLSTIEMRYIEVVAMNYGVTPVAGTIFEMGAPFNEQGAHATESPRYPVLATSFTNGSNSFWVSAKECSQQTWEELHKVVGSGGPLELLSVDDSEAEKRRVETVAFLEGDKSLRAIESQNLSSVTGFCTSLQAQIGAVVRLPSEVEWEYVCRAGTATAYWSGRLLQSLGQSALSGNVTASEMLYAYDQNDMRTKIKQNPWGDPSNPTVNPPWEINAIGTVDLNGKASFNKWNMKITIGGKLTLSGGTFSVAPITTFDSRFQNRYRPDFYGSYSPILMVYELVGTIYEPRPYADINSPGNLYFRYLDVSDAIAAADYVPVGSVSVATGFHNQLSNNQDNPADKLVTGTVPGDFYNGRQLEYREMIQVLTRYNAGGVEDPKGDHMKDFNGRLYPIRSMYHPTPFWDSGARRRSTFPEVGYDYTPDIEKLARAENLNALGDPDMNTDDYVQTLKEELELGFNKKGDFDAGFYTGSTPGIKTFSGFAEGLPFSRMYDEIEFIINGGYTFEINPLGRNPWGLFDVHGNVEEWTSTTWDGRSNGKNHVAGPFQITKGGSWRTGADKCRSAARTARDPNRAYDDVGFRFIIEQ